MACLSYDAASVKVFVYCISLTFRNLGSVLLVNPDAHKFAKEFYNFLGSAGPSGKAKLESNPVRLMPGGLERVVSDGFALLGSGPVSQRTRLERSEDYMRPISGEKLVYKIG